MQTILETELLVDVVNNIREHPNIRNDGTFIIPDSLTESINKYGNYSALSELTMAGRY
jgi:hypothetical protein